MRKSVAILAAAAAVLLAVAHERSHARADKPEHRAYVMVERLETTGPESLQEDYGRLAREILPRFGGRYLARSRNNVLLEGDGPAPCCVALLEFPNPEAAQRWYQSPENRDAS